MTKPERHYCGFCGNRIWDLGVRNRLKPGLRACLDCGTSKLQKFIAPAEFYNAPPSPSAQRARERAKAKSLLVEKPPIKKERKWDITFVKDLWKKMRRSFGG